MTMVRQFDDDERCYIAPSLLPCRKIALSTFYIDELFEEKFLCSSCSSLANCVNYILLYNDLMLYVQVEQLP